MQLYILIVIVNLIYLSGASEVPDLKEDESKQQNLEGYEINRYPIPGRYVENRQQNQREFDANRYPIPGGYVESRQQNVRGYESNKYPIPGAYITTYDPSRGPYTLEYPGYDLESLLGPRYELPAEEKGYYGVNSGLNNYKLDARREPENIDYGQYPFEKLPYQQYRLEGRQGLGFDKRTAYALGMRYPLTPQLIETVVRPKYSKLGSEQTPENTSN